MATFEVTLDPEATTPDATGNYSDARSRNYTGFYNNNDYGGALRYGGFVPAKEGTKYQYKSYVRFEMAIPTYASIDKAKFRIQALNDVSTPDRVYLGLLEKDGKWDPIAGNTVFAVQKAVPYFIIEGDGGTIAVQGNNGGQASALLVRNINTRYLATKGVSVKVGTEITKLEEIKLEVQRRGSDPGNIQLEIYNTVSPTDPLPTGNVIARSDVIDKLTLPLVSGGVFTVFPFSGVDQIPLSVNQRVAVKVVDSDNTTLGPTQVQWVFDSGYSGDNGLDSNSSLNDDNHLLNWSTILQNGWNINAYLSHQDLPWPTGRNSLDLIPGVLFQDTRNLFAVPDQILGSFQEWGTSGYAADGVFPFHSRIAAWIADPGYDPSGSPIGITYQLGDDPTPDYVVSQRHTDNPAAPQLIIEYSFDPPVAPTDPVPADEATGVSVTQVLSWTAGVRTETYDVYFGTEPSPGAGEFIGNQPEISYDPGTLEFGTTYYWRIDAVNDAGTTPGTVWSFSTPNPVFIEEGGDVIQYIVEAFGDVTQDLIEVGGDTFLNIIEVGGDTTQALSEDSEDVYQNVIEDGGDVTSGG